MVNIVLAVVIVLMSVWYMYMPSEEIEQYDTKFAQVKYRKHTTVSTNISFDSDSNFIEDDKNNEHYESTPSAKHKQIVITGDYKQVNNTEAKEIKKSTKVSYVSEYERVAEDIEDSTPFVSHGKKEMVQYGTESLERDNESIEEEDEQTAVPTPEIFEPIQKSSDKKNGQKKETNDKSNEMFPMPPASLMKDYY